MSEYGQRALSPYETRSAVILASTRAMLDQSTETLASFAIRVAQTYMAGVPADRRVISFEDPDTAPNAKEYERRVDTLRHHAGNFLKGITRFPADLEEWWVDAMVDPWRSRCRAELQMRHGFLPVPIPSASDLDPHLSDLVTLGHTHATFADVVAISGRMLADGQFDPSDRAHLPELIAALGEMTAALSRLLTHAQAGVDGIRRGDQQAD